MTFAQWVEFCAEVRHRAERIDRMRHDRGWAIAATVGIPRNCCCLHNASIDTECKGWSADGPHVWKTARLAKRFVDDWRASRLADSIIARAWRTVTNDHGVRYVA